MYVAKFPKKGTAPFPRKISEDELWNNTKNNFWRKYQSDLANYGFSPSRKNFEQCFANHKYNSWLDAKKSYRKLVASSKKGEVPEVPHDLIYKEPWEYPIETLDEDALLERISIDTYRLYSNWGNETHERDRPSLEDLLVEINIDKKGYCGGLNKIVKAIDNFERDKIGNTKYANVIVLLERDREYVESLLEQCKCTSIR